MADDAAPPPPTPAPDEAREPPPAQEPRPAPPAARPKRRSAFRRSDELGLILLAMVLTGIVWAIARGSVIEERPPIENVRVVWERTPGSVLDVVFTKARPTVDVVLTASDPEYQEIRGKLLRDGLVLRVGRLDPNQSSRDLSDKDGDGDRYVLPFPPELLAGRKLPLPAGRVERIETGWARIVPPDISQLTLPGGLRADFLELDPGDSIKVDNVRAGLLKDELPADMPTIDQFRLDTPLGSEGIRWISLRFKGWTGEAKDPPDPDPSRAAAAEAMGEVRMKVRIYGGTKQAIDNEWRWARSQDDIDRFEFRLQQESPIGVNGSQLTGTLEGTETELAFVAQNKGKWHWEIALFAADKDERNAWLPKTNEPEKKDVPGQILFVTDGDPRFGRVRFVPKDPEQTTQVRLTIQRKN